MANLLLALFEDSQKAGEVVAEFKAQNYTKDISVVSKDLKGVEIDATTHTVKQTVTDGAAVGAATGGAIGALAVALAGLTAVSVPALGIFIAGPLATTLAGVAAGAVAGGLAGSLIDLGLPDNIAADYANQIDAGQTLVAVTFDPEFSNQATELAKRHNASAVQLGNI
jgi:uncharacterized membrane protein